MKRIPFLLLLGFWVLPWHAVFAQGTAHSNTITWTASTTVGVTSYKVYRGVVVGGPYTNVGSVASSASPLQYVDGNTTLGTRHYYVVTALVGASESVFSAEVNVVDAGSNVNPPTGVGVTSQ